MLRRIHLLAAGLCVAALMGPAWAGQVFVQEREDNNAAVRATPIAKVNAVGRGSIYPQADVDYWSFTAIAGERVYAATMTSDSAAMNYDTVLDLLASNGSTVLESDNDDGSLSGTASSIAGCVIPATGTYYLRVTALGFLPQVRPYFLHLQVQPSAAGAEVEPNNAGVSANPLPPNHKSGTHSAADSDWFQIALAAGDSLFLSVNADPERNSITWNPRLAFGALGDAQNQMLIADDASVTAPNSEALFVTVKSAGTYFVRVDSASSPGGATETYRLSASVHPASIPSQACTTYSSDDPPLAIPDAGSTVATLEVPDSVRISGLRVSLQLNHPVMADLDVHLIGPGGNSVGLFTDVGSTALGGQSQMDLELDDAAAFPIGAYTVMKGVVVQPEARYRLAWFDGADAAGTWTLKLWDDTLNGNAGLVNAWSITVCPAEPVCNGVMVAVYSSDFEGDDGEFTHSGTLDQWALGLPSGDSAPLVGCNSGSSCWKTNLTGSYADDALMLLRSPEINLSLVSAPIRATWAQAYQMENAAFDAMQVDLDDLTTAGSARLFQWLDSTMDDDVGVSSATYVNMSSGWGVKSANLDANAGHVVQLAFGLSTDGFVGYSGLAINDVAISACCNAACCTAAQCDDFDPCTTDSCSFGSGCSHLPTSGPACSDGNACTINDVCNAGACVGSSVVAAVNNSVRLGKSGGSSTLTWSEPPGTFNVYRGSRGPGVWSYNHACFDANLESPPSIDSQRPANGTAFYYLVSREGACGESPLGASSAGLPTPNPSPCP